MSSTPGKPRLVDQLEERLLKFDPLLEILEAVGVDPEGPEAKRLVSCMLAGLDDGIQRMEKETASHSRWTRVDDTILTLAIARHKRECGSERKAIKRIAADPAYSFTSYKRQNGRRTPKSNQQTQYEETLRRRWMKIKKDQKLWWEDFKAKGLEAYDPVATNWSRTIFTLSPDADKFKGKRLTDKFKAKGLEAYSYGPPSNVLRHTLQRNED
jgi:hypothetical protein